MADEKLKITDENREAALKVALAFGALKDLDAAIPARRQRLEQELNAQRQQFEQSAQQEREKRLKVLQEAQAALIGDAPEGTFVSIAEDATTFTIHRPEKQLGPGEKKRARRAARQAKQAAKRAPPKRRAARRPARKG